MVKNTGGKHGKKLARKNAVPLVERRLRFCESDEELYGIVSKCLGNGHFLTVCSDQVERLCFLRNKFTGRNKHGNLVSVGSWVIVGLRSWETTKPNKKDKCDLLEIYTNNEKHRLLQECKSDISFLIKQENVILNIDGGDEQCDDHNTIIFRDEPLLQDDNESHEHHETDEDKDNTQVLDYEDIDFDEI